MPTGRAAGMPAHNATALLNYCSTILILYFNNRPVDNSDGPRGGKASEHLLNLYTPLLRDYCTVLLYYTTLLYYFTTLLLYNPLLQYFTTLP